MFSCEECRRQLVGNPSNEMIPQGAWNLAGRLLLEEISAAGIAGATKISDVWTQQYIRLFRSAMRYGLLSAQRRARWIWIAIDRRSRKLAGIMLENCRVSFWPPGRHFSAGKESGKASHVERLNLTLRRRAPRLGRKTPPFSENTRNHIGAIWNSIHH